MGIHSSYRIEIMTENLCLKWNDFQENINSALGSFRSDQDFTDVTLACEDGDQVEAHKVILAASSPFFENLLRKNKHPHPLIYMRGVKSEDLVAIVDFLYYGEANIQQTNIEAFLAIAEELKLTGVSGSLVVDKTEKPAMVKEEFAKTNKLMQPKISGTEKAAIQKEGVVKINKVILPKLSGTDRCINTRKNQVENMRKIPTFDMSKVSGGFKEIDQKIMSMIVPGQTTYKQLGKVRKNHQCTVCGKEAKYSNIKEHIETNHGELL